VPWFTFEGEARSKERSETSLGALFVFEIRGSTSVMAIYRQSLNNPRLADGPA